MTIRSQLSLLLFLVGAPLSHGLLETLTLKQISRPDGLPSTTVRAIVQDHQGIMWFGFEAGGLASYNGSEFSLFRHNPEQNQSGLSSDYVNALLVDKSGQLWIGTEEGLDRYNPQKNDFDRIALLPAARSRDTGRPIVTDLIEDAKGRIWATTDVGVFCLRTQTGTFEQIRIRSATDSDALSRVHSQGIFQDSSGEIWLASRAGVFQYNEAIDRFQAPSHIDFGERHPRSVEFFDVEEDQQGNLWFAHQSGLGRFDRFTQTYEEIDLNASSSNSEETNVAELLRDSRGNLWVGTFSDGLRTIDPQTNAVQIHRVDPFQKQSILSNSIRALFEDRNGLIWIGSKFEGIFIYDSVIETFPLTRGQQDSSVGMRGQHVLSILEDKDGIVWIGTKRGGLNAYDRQSGSFEAYYPRLKDPDSLFDNRVEALYQDAAGILWLGSEKGLSRFDIEAQSFRNYSAYIVRNIIQSEDERLYVGTNYGLQLFDPATETFSEFEERNGIDLSTRSRIEVKKLYRDSQGRLLIGTHHDGLYLFSPNSQNLAAYLPDPDDTQSISGDQIRSIFEDSKGRIWIGTRLNGLNLFDPSSESFARFGADQGLLGQSVFGIQEDDRGLLWLTTNKGIFSFDPENIVFTNFNEDYGLQSDVFEPNAIDRSVDGTLLVGGAGGVNIFDPSLVSRRNLKTNMVLSSISVFEKILAKEEWSEDEVELKHNENYLTFSFALTDYGSPGQNEFRYKLEGLDEDWLYSGRRNYMYYTALAPGEYRFLAQGRPPSGDWSEDVLSLDIAILPPIWKTGAFFILASLAFLALLVSIFLLLTRRQRYRRHLLEAQVTERTNELKSANERLAAQSNALATQQENLELQVKRRTKELEGAKRKAEESDRLKSSFLANMSHEIRTPMNAIIGFSQMIADTNCEENEKREFSEIIQSNCSTLVRLIDDILDISLIEAGQLRISESDFDVNKLLRDLDNTIRAGLSDLHRDGFDLRIAENIEEGPRYIRTDPQRLTQILTNLINNALKFTSQGHVSLQYCFDETNRRIYFDVEDTGIGIKQEHIEDIWVRFRKIENDSQKVFRGTGLGLSITRNLVQRLGGEIAVKSEPGHGSTFRLWLPWVEVSASEVKPDPTSALRPQKNPDREAHTGIPTLLVAEDEDYNFLLIEKIVPPDQAKVVHVKDGKAAVDYCRANYPAVALVFLDIKMPILNGKEAARIIKTEYPDLPVLAYTAYASIEEEKEIMEYGFDGYIRKPTSRDAVLGALADCLQGVRY